MLLPALIPALLLLPQDPQPPPLERAALAVLSSKCVECHGPDLAFPKARFGFVTDPRRLIASGAFVVPGRPDDSEIWKQIDAGDMPPDTAKAGPLSDTEKQAIHDWIASLAPAQPTNDSALPPEPPRTDPSNTLSPVHRAVLLLGRLHLVALHFPIALLTTAAGTVAWSWLRRAPEPEPLVRLCLWLGGISSLLAAALGWIHATDGFGAPFADILSPAGLHRWAGTAAALLAPVAIFLWERGTRSGVRSPTTRLAVLALGGLVALAGHLGGLLTHGPSFLSP